MTERKPLIDLWAPGYVAEAEGPDDELLTTPQVARWLKLSESFLTNGRSQGYGPEYVKISNTLVRYRRGDVRRWLVERDQTFRGTASTWRPAFHR